MTRHFYFTCSLFIIIYKINLLFIHYYKINNIWKSSCWQKRSITAPIALPMPVLINTFWLINTNNQTPQPLEIITWKIMQKKGLLKTTHVCRKNVSFSYSSTRETQEARFGLLVRSGYSDTRRMGCFGRSERLDQECCRVVILPTTEEMPPTSDN